MVLELGQFVENFVDGLEFLVGAVRHLLFLPSYSILIFLQEGSVIEKYRTVAMRKQVDKTAELNQVFGGLDTILSTFGSFSSELKVGLEKWQETEELGAIIAKWVTFLCR